MKSVLIFLSLLVLLALLGASGAATHAVWAKDMAASGPGSGGGAGVVLILHLLAACVLTGIAFAMISDANNKS